MKYFLIAGEASGDLHGANLIKAIRRNDPEGIFEYWGGDRMKAEADGLLVHYKDVTIMGFVEVLFKLRTVLGNIEKCKQQIAAFKPDVVILIDYPGFNLRIAEFCKQTGIKVCYYIAPKIWAWKEKRGEKLERFVDELWLIFPFEVEYFKKWNVHSTFVGNPLLDEIASFKPDAGFYTNNQLDGRSIIALLPGSRKQEISRMLPVMLQTISHYPDKQFVIAGAPGIDPSFYTPYLNNNVKVIFNQTYQLLHHAQAAIVCSGTATLETALFRVPQVCGYAGNPVSYAIAKLLVKIKYISLVNLNLNKPAITELIQGDFTPHKIIKELDAVLPGGDKHDQLMKDYDHLHKIMGGEGASGRAAERLLRMVNK